MPQVPKKTSNFIGTEKALMEGYIRALDSDVMNIMQYLSRFPRQIEASTEPTLSADEWILWRDTDDDKMYIIWKKNSNQKKVELT